ncbi:lipopolysaccharide export system protein LptA [Hasllibacter halocynthiae]|uniref:Lipopolysaccharide export system protein LptA n=1 Tax=Hasllibacter halocynthiae TaxID=595589 RepID=A0A2T0X2C0_9RHOB|nr:LptA/OstA family protein [Hasllibacter halocynthiae]PRY93004.1 lipopolysaccharide export system protein LptA [Hasllibacter halocynthiae]
MRPFVLILALVVGAPALSQVPFGGGAQDVGAPVEVTADSLSVARNGGSAVFEGGVVIGQGEIRLSAARVEVAYDGENRRIARLDATGGVTLVSGPDAAEARSASYDVDAGVVVLTGDVLLSQGETAISADSATVNLATGEAQAEGNVRTVLQ